ncbi:MAG: hypothetical protein HFF00_07720 [Ruminiclostridium sp.]|jgi:hypothetical protein|nr:hypothetical protein [Ruminiclostridium sp.]
MVKIAKVKFIESPLMKILVVINMKNARWDSIIPRAVLCITVVLVQYSLLSFSRADSYRILNHSLTVICCVFSTMLILFLSLSAKYRDGRYLYFLIECIGSLVSLLTYKNLLENFAGVPDDLRRFILVPYLIALALSLAVWVLKKQGFGRADPVPAKVPDWTNQERTLYFALVLASILFAAYGIYVCFEAGNISRQWIGVLAFLVSGLALASSFNVRKWGMK